MMIRYVIRNAVLDDFDRILDLAKMLNTVNLPNDPVSLHEVLSLSVNSFNGEISDPTKREYLFVLEDKLANRIVGSSQIIAQHGTREMPHIFYEVSRSERYSNSIDKHFKHQVLRLGLNYEGPTEIGGLIVDPDYRHVPEKLGRQLSIMRFVFIAMNRECFQNRVLAELLPPFLENGQSLLWERLGKKLTGLEYHKADHISRTNKEFIIKLFPSGEIYTCLLGNDVEQIIGAVGAASLPAKKMLESIGFSYENRVDPFDGGPHLEADCEDIEPINGARILSALNPKQTLTDTKPFMIASLKDGFKAGAQFEATVIEAQFDQKECVLHASPEIVQSLDFQKGSTLWAYDMSRKP